MFPLAGLAITTTGALRIMNALSQGHGGPQLFDLEGVLRLLRDSPTAPAIWWVYVTLFSTILPTVFHATVAAASFVTWSLPERNKRHWLSLMESHDLRENHQVLVGMAWRLTLMEVVTVLLALGSASVLFALLWEAPWLGKGLLWLCEIVAGVGGG